MRRLSFFKYHALRNDFLVLEAGGRKLSRSQWRNIAVVMCDRRAGLGADGIAVLSKSTRADRKVSIFNADGTWAEKSGNGLRIAGAHLYRTKGRRKVLTFETATSIDTVRINRNQGRGQLMATASLGEPDFRSKKVPVKSRHRYHINAPLRIGGVQLPVTCVSVGNPHCVLVVDNFEFDWQALGADIEWSKPFPSGTNVEFVQVVNRKKIRVADWERGAGATGSSGTGAAASVSAMVMMGLVDRSCMVDFETGSLEIQWSEETNVIEVTGPVQFVGQGTFNLP